MNSKTTIIHLCDMTSKSFIGSYLRFFSASLSKRQIRSVIVICKAKHHNNTVDIKEDCPTYFIDQDGAWDFKAIWSLRNIIRKEKASIVHIHNVSTLHCGTVAARLAGIKSLNTVHQKVEKRTPKTFWRMNSYVVSSSEYLKQFLTKHNKIAANKLRVIPDGYTPSGNGVKTQDIRSKLGLPADSFLIGNIAPLVRHEDQETLLKMFRKLMRKKMNSDLLIIGRGPLRPNLEAIAEEYEIKDRVHFLEMSEVARIKEILVELDAVVFTRNIPLISPWVYEAMAAGKPVIVTKIGNYPEIVDEASGFLVPCGFPERIESAVMRIYANRDLLQNMGQAAQKRFNERFEMDVVASGYDEVYSTMLK